MKTMAVTALMLMACLPAGAFGQDSLAHRLDKIRGMVDAIDSELDSLRRDLEASRAGTPVAPESSRTGSSGTKPILGELLSERQKRLAGAAAFPYDRLAIGYSFDAALGIGMHTEGWTGRWGWRGAATGRFTGDTRWAGFEVAALRSLHRFSLLEGWQTRLYALAGAGIFWRREPYPTGYPTYTPVLNPPVGRRWYETPDLPMRAQVGVGTELGLFTLGGLRAAPEIGLQASHFLRRYQDSPSWENLAASQPGFETRPKSDFSLDPYFAFHLSFYFR